MQDLKNVLSHWQGKIPAIIRRLIINDKMHEDETGYQKGKIQKRKIVETEIFSVDERIEIIGGMVAIIEKRKDKIYEKGINTYFRASKLSIIKIN